MKTEKLIEIEMEESFQQGLFLGLFITAIGACIVAAISSAVKPNKLNYANEVLNDPRYQIDTIVTNTSSSLEGNTYEIRYEFVDTEKE